MKIDEEERILISICEIVFLKLSEDFNLGPSFRWP